jgi:hypothetical protein
MRRTASLFELHLRIGTYCTREQREDQIEMLMKENARRRDAGSLSGKPAWFLWPDLRFAFLSVFELFAGCVAPEPGRSFLCVCGPALPPPKIGAAQGATGHIVWVND